MTFSDAAATVIPFGKYQGKTIDQIALSNEGLLYLDWLFDHMLLSPDLQCAINMYLSDPMISLDLEDCLEEHDWE